MNDEFYLLGYLLVSPDWNISSDPTKAYFGTDRHPYTAIYPNPDDVFVENDIKTKWFDALEEREYIESYELAASLQQEFLSMDLKLDLLMCEIWLKELMKPLPINLLESQPPPPGFFLYGYDVARPVGADHSLIFQPNPFHDRNPHWVKRLNSYGLFSTCEEAREFRNSIVASIDKSSSYSVFAFEIIRVFGNRKF